MSGAHERLAGTSAVHLCTARKLRMAAEFMKTGEVRCECVLVASTDHPSLKGLSAERMAAYAEAARRCREGLADCRTALNEGDRAALKEALGVFLGATSDVSSVLTT